MHLVQLLLPLRDRNGATFPADHYRAVSGELTRRFGGLTAYTRSPAEGLWKEGGGVAERDDIVVYEVMVPDLDRDWWSGWREELERRFAQEELVVRALAMERL